MILMIILLCLFVLCLERFVCGGGGDGSSGGGNGVDATWQCVYFF